MSFNRKDLLGLEHLDKKEIQTIIDAAKPFKNMFTRSIKKAPALIGKTVVTLFYEPSTRTRTSFEVAAKRLSADVVNIATATSSVVKGESLVDTAKTLEAMKADIIIARYGELALKSDRVRRRFEKRLVHNIKESIDGEVNIRQARIYIDPVDFDDTLEKLGRIFGIVSYSPAVSTKSTFEDIEKTVSDYTDYLVDEGLIDGNTKFAISCRRVGDHDFSSQEMAAFAGAVVVRKIGAPVDLSNPELTIFLEVRDGDTYVYHEKIPGPGGLPLGTQGKVVALVSSGIDSPVATYLMMKRGCQVIALYCDNNPYTSPEALKNFEDLIDQLNLYASGAPIKKRVVKYGDYLSTCKSEGPERMTCVLCKSGMYKLAGKLAKKLHAEAVIDGSSLGQVASQTLPNILATREDLDVPVLSPLIGLDKLEITRIAEKIGTFEISKRDDGGCKAVPRYPETNADLEFVKQVKEEINQIVNPYIEDTGWKDLEILDGFVNHSEKDKAQYRRIGKTVQIRGALKNTSAYTPAYDGDKIAQLPDKTCYPSQRITTLQQGTGANKMMVRVDPDGSVVVGRYHLRRRYGVADERQSRFWRTEVH